VQEHLNVQSNKLQNVYLKNYFIAYLAYENLVTCVSGKDRERK